MCRIVNMPIARSSYSKCVDETQHHFMAVTERGHHKKAYARYCYFASSADSTDFDSTYLADEAEGRDSPPLCLDIIVPLTGMMVLRTSSSSSRASVQHNKGSIDRTGPSETSEVAEIEKSGKERETAR